VNRIESLFKNKKQQVLSVYFTAGYPTLDSTLTVAHSLQKAGADLIEIGIPFSDPIADGPVIQQSNKVALENGMNVPLLLDQLKQIRTQCSIPIVLMGYLNPIMQYGISKFIRDAAAAGADGLIIPDLPVYEYEQLYQHEVEANGLCISFLVSPTTSVERLTKIDQVTRGFIYAVSSSSTTGAKESFTPEQESYFSRLQASSLKNPFLIGFGISNKNTFQTASKYAAGAIIGSAFIRLLGSSENLESDITQFVNSIK